MYRLLPFALSLLVMMACNSTASNTEIQAFLENNSTIVCNEAGCSGEYTGPEYKFNVDIAHRFSNLMSEHVGAHLKALYSNGKYSRVQLTAIKMSTKGMGSGRVMYRLDIPFSSVKEKCKAYTAFDHVGGWGHQPELKMRKKELERELIQGDRFTISQLHTTPQGLKEYWIQWRHKEVQAICNN